MGGGGEREMEGKSDKAGGQVGGWVGGRKGKGSGWREKGGHGHEESRLIYAPL